ncbi:AAA family ATPase [Amycolatopsis sp. lyj-90]|uniref:AAA family ATPase n=1 Tax=Amycolatopsis sp. lyj-90 TaxID=2789285 RepID=UPI00397C844A
MILYGRHQEKLELDRALEGARQSRGTALVLWGDPGIGKTALLGYATAAATGFTVLSCRGTRMESGLAFAALHELLWPAVDRVGTLPPPQAAALRGALGHSGETADRFLIGVATLTLLSELAAERPVLITVDDADLLDEPTAECLAFVARRLRAEPIALLLTGHADPASEGLWEPVPGLEIGPLSESDAVDLVRRETAAPDEEAVRRTVRMAAGNPLALRELPGVPQEAGEYGSIGPRLRRAFGARAARLSDAARTWLLVAAAEDRGVHHSVREAAAVLGANTVAGDEVLRSGLLTVTEGRLRFRTPLLAAAVYEDAPFTQRQAVHRALAQTLRGKDDEGLRAWHLAAAAAEPDEDVAVLLERSAGNSRTRGGHASAARALRRAAELSPAPSEAARRFALGAQSACEAGQVSTALDLLDRADELASEEAVAAASGGLRGLIEFANGDQEHAHRLLLRDTYAVTDPGTAVELACVAVRAGWSAGSPQRQAEALHRLEKLAVDGDFAEAALLPVLEQWWGSGPKARPDEAVTPLGAVSWRLLPPAPLAVAWGAERPMARAYRREVDRLRRTEAVQGLMLTVSQTVTIDIVAGRWTEAAANAAETLRLAEEMKADHAASQCRNSLSWLAALRGDEQAVTDLTTRTLELSVPRGVRALTAAATWNLGQAALFLGRPQEALDHLARLTEPGNQAAHATFALLAAEDTVEAAVRVGRPELGTLALRALRAWAERAGAAWAVAAAHRCTAQLAGEGAEDSFLHALEVQGVAEHPFSHARTRLLYGEWLRRARRRTEARVQLTEAAEVFRRLGAAPLLERSLNEEELTGRRPNRAQPDTGRTEPLLTPQELRVARLAADGLTNREIAAQLLISPRTVGHHLSSVFPKLGIAGRTELAEVDFEDGPRVGR